MVNSVPVDTMHSESSASATARLFTVHLALNHSLKTFIIHDIHPRNLLKATMKLKWINILKQSRLESKQEQERAYRSVDCEWMKETA